MSLFGKKKSKTVSVSKDTELATEIKGQAKKGKKSLQAEAVQKTGKFAKEKITEDIILEPWVTEKAHNQITENKYIFRVHKRASKEKIKRAIETMYNVSVTAVNIVNIPPKKRNYGKQAGEKAGYKKAIIKLKEGDKIELFKGV